MTRRTPASAIVARNDRNAKVHGLRARVADIADGGNSVVCEFNDPSAIYSKLNDIKYGQFCHMCDYFAFIRP